VCHTTDRPSGHQKECIHTTLGRLIPEQGIELERVL
jgi:hypothetical protein